MRKSLLISVIIMAVILGITMLAFTKIHNNTEKNCVSELHNAVIAADNDVKEILDNTYSTLEDYGTIVTEYCELDPEAVSGLLKSARIGVMQMEMRLYLPDGRIITGDDIRTGNADMESYDTILSSFNSEGRYISSIRTDLVHPELQVIEIYRPVKTGDGTVAIISAVMDVSQICDYIKTPLYSGNANILVVDRRDGMYFLNDFHSAVFHADTFRDRISRDGNTISSQIDRVLNGEEVFFAHRGKDGRELYSYVIPSSAYKDWSVNISVLEPIAFASDRQVERMLIYISVGEVLLFVLFFLWLQRSNRREAEKMKELAVARVENDTNTVLHQMIKAGPWRLTINKNNEVVGTYYSPECMDVLQINSGKDIAWAATIVSEDRERVDEAIFACLRDPDCRTPLDVEFRINTKNGDCRWIHSAARMRRDPDGTGECYGICIDIDDTVKTREMEKQQLALARDEAEAANRSKTDFLFNMSHDIRTPMNAITGFTNMAIKHIDDREKVLDCLDKTQKSGSMLLSLINSVLEVSRIESGHAMLEEQHGDVFYSFANIENTMREMAKTKDIDLSFSFDNIKDRYVYADFSRCMRIFVNIISNAIKYTPEGGTVKVLCEQLGAAKDGYGTYRYTVADNGIGMSEEFQKHILDQFAREETSTVSGIQGSGLGMTVVKSFTELMGGSVNVQSRQGEGTAITVILPFRIQESESYTDPVSGEVVSADNRTINAPEHFDFSGRKGLIVEDNELNREIAVEILEEEGLEADEAEDGTVAVRLLKEKGPAYYDFILMDIQMPVMNSYEATRAIRAMYPDKHIPIIALSANAFAEDKKKSLEAGMDDHVAKPINVKEFFSVLAKHL